MLSIVAKAIPIEPKKTNPTILKTIFNITVSKKAKLIFLLNSGNITTIDHSKTKITFINCPRHKVKIKKNNIFELTSKKKESTIML